MSAQLPQIHWHASVHLKVGELGVVEVRVDVQRGAHHQQQLKLVQGGADVAGEAETPDLQESFQVKQHGEGNLGWNGEGRHLVNTHVAQSYSIRWVNYSFNGKNIIIIIALSILIEKHCSNAEICCILIVNKSWLNHSSVHIWCYFSGALMGICKSFTDAVVKKSRSV